MKDESLACCRPWGCKVTHNLATEQQCTALFCFVAWVSAYAIPSAWDLLTQLDPPRSYLTCSPLYVASSTYTLHRSFSSTLPVKSVCLHTLWTLWRWKHLSKLVYLFFFFWPHHEACGILAPRPGIKPVPLRWKLRVFTTGPSLKTIFKLCGVKEHFEILSRKTHKGTKFSMWF